MNFPSAAKTATKAGFRLVVNHPYPANDKIALTQSYATNRKGPRRPGWPTRTFFTTITSPKVLAARVFVPATNQLVAVRCDPLRRLEQDGSFVKEPLRACFLVAGVVIELCKTDNASRRFIIFLSVNISASPFNWNQPIKSWQGLDRLMR